MNPAVQRLTRWGLGVWGARELTVVGRRSGQPRSVPVNVLRHDGRDHLVAARGVTEWVRNLRAAGGGTLRVGRRQRSFQATELADDEKVEVLRAYLRRWAFEIGTFFDGVDADSSDDELRAVAGRHPVFVLDHDGPATA